MTTRDKMISLHNKVKEYDQFKKGFSIIIDRINEFLDGFDTPIFEPIEDNQLYGFDQTISVSWKFIFDENLPYGEMVVSHQKEKDITDSFFTCYFDSKGWTYSKPGEKMTSEHSLSDSKLFFMIIDDFFKLECFKASDIA